MYRQGRQGAWLLLHPLLAASSSSLPPPLRLPHPNLFYAFTFHLLACCRQIYYTSNKAALAAFGFGHQELYLPAHSAALSLFFLGASSSSLFPPPFPPSLPPSLPP